MGILRKIRKKITNYYLFRDAPLLSEQNLMDFVSVISGSFDGKKLTLFSIFKDEVYFCAAFFDHYRSIGVEQFLILDDGSSDGTSDFLTAQKDCVVLKSSLNFGQVVRFNNIGRERDCVYASANSKLKCLIPHVFLNGRFGLYVDADEFLILPPGVDCLSEIIAQMEQRNELCIAGPMVDFFPCNLTVSLHEPSPPRTLRELLQDNPFFDTSPLIKIDEEGIIQSIGEFKSTKMFRKYLLSSVIKSSPEGRKDLWLKYTYKTPILKHLRESYRYGAHSVNVPVSPNIVLPLAHFTFTENLSFKVERAIAWRAHADDAAKYFAFRDLIDEITCGNAELTDNHSREFHSVKDLLDCGLMCWPSK